MEIARSDLSYDNDMVGWENDGQSDATLKICIYIRFLLPGDFLYIFLRSPGVPFLIGQGIIITDVFEVGGILCCVYGTYRCVLV